MTSYVQASALHTLEWPWLVGHVDTGQGGKRGYGIDVRRHRSTVLHGDGTDDGGGGGDGGGR